MTVNEIISALQEIKDKDRNVTISKDGDAKDVISVDWMDCSDTILLFIETEE